MKVPAAILWCVGMYALVIGACYEVVDPDTAMSLAAVVTTLCVLVGCEKE